MSLFYKTGYLIIINLFILLNANAQDSNQINYNLDFEKIEDGKFKGWEDFGSENYKLEVDSTHAQNGKYSAKIEYIDGKQNFRAWSYTIPANFKGENIKLSGYIKTDNVNNGFAGLWLRVDPSISFNNMYDQGVIGTKDWQKFEIELKLEYLKAEKIVFGGLLAGDGKMWLDNLELTVDGKNLKELEKYEKPLLEGKIQEDYITQINKAKTVLNFKTQKKLDKSLHSLIDYVGDKKIVSIGEDTHGTSEYYKIREEITKKLIQEKGFNTIILESPYDDIELLTKDIQNNELDSLIRNHLFSIYQTEEMKSFLNWFKTNNSKLNIQFKGSDDSYWVFDQLLSEEVKALNNPEVKILSESFIEKTTLNFEEYQKKYPQSNEIFKNEIDLSNSAYRDILTIEDLLIASNKYSDRLKELIFNAKTSYVNFENLANGNSVESRDEIMAKRISFFAKDPNAKIIVWAHNAHISNTVIIDNEIGIMGKNLKNEFNDDYHSIGLSSYSGNYSYIENKFINGDHNYNDSLMKANLNLISESSWENTFKEVSEKPFFFHTKEIKPNSTLGTLKLIGYGKEDESDHYKLTPINMFDTIIFFEKTTATNPIFN